MTTIGIHIGKIRYFTPVDFFAGTPQYRNLASRTRASDGKEIYEFRENPG
jgi:hypothetical protein